MNEWARWQKSENCVFWNDWIRKRFPCAQLVYYTSVEHNLDADDMKKDQLRRYNEWVIQCLIGMYAQDPPGMGRSIVPYYVQLNTGMKNLPPRDCQLLHSTNEKKRWCDDSWFISRLGSMVRRLEPYSDFEKKWIDDLTEWHLQRDLRPVEYVNLSTHFTFASGVPPNIKLKFYQLFEMLFPMPLPALPQFNQDKGSYDAYQESISKEHEKWVGRYYEHFEALPENWTSTGPKPINQKFPVPYVRENDHLWSIPPLLVIPDLIRLADGEKRYRKMEAYSKMKFPSLWFGKSFSIHSPTISQTLDEMLDYVSKSGIVNQKAYSIYYYIQNNKKIPVESYTWGNGGSLKQNYPNSWKLEYFSKKLSNKDSDQIYGYIPEFPIPYEASADYGLPNAYEKRSPPLDMFNYWYDLIQARNANFSKPSSFTKYLKVVDEKYKGKLTDFNQWLINIFPEYVSIFGLNIDHKFGNDMDKSVSEWKNAMFQALHLRMAEKHAATPWALWGNLADERQELPPEVTIESKGFKMEWFNYIWDKKYLKDVQKNFREGVPFSSPSVIAWPVLYQLLFFCDSQMKTNRKINLEKNPALYRAFCEWMYRGTPSGVISPEGKKSDIIAPLRTTWWSDCLGITSASWPQTWINGVNYTAQKMYKTLVSQNDNILLERAGFSPINTKDLTKEPKDNKPENGGMNPVDWLKENTTDLDIETGVWEFWKKCWMVTEFIQEWPSYYWDGQRFQLIKESIKANAGYYEKAWNTVKDFLFGKGTNQFVNDLNPNAEKYKLNGKEYPIFKQLVLPYKERYPDDVMQCWKFIQNNQSFLPPIKEQGGKSDGDWIKSKEKQWSAFREWVKLNAFAKLKYEKYLIAEKTKLPSEYTDEERKGSFYVLPGEYLKNMEGNPVYATELPPGMEGSGEPLKNVVANYNVFDFSGGKDKKSYGWIFSIGNWAVALQELLVWVAKVVTGIVVSVLKEILTGLGLDGFWGVFLIGGAVLIGGYVAYKMEIENKS